MTSRPDLTPYLGKEVDLLIDRPLGSVHPAWVGVPYPVNYGYVPGTVGGDREPIDAYLLGVDEPVIHANGVVVALVLREDDNEDKLVVAPEGCHLSEDEIREAGEDAVRSTTGHEIEGTI